MRKTYYTYILKFNDNRYYTGVTNNIETRLSEHQNGIHKNCFTFYRRPVKLVHCVSFYNINEAIAREKQIKGWNRKKKEALINENIDQLIKLSNHNKNCRPSASSE